MGWRKSLMNIWECRWPSPLPGGEVSPTSSSTLYTNGSADGRGHLPGFGVSPKNSLFFSPPQAAKRIALYWHNGRSLGHTVRCATLGQALLNHMPNNIV